MAEDGGAVLVQHLRSQEALLQGRIRAVVHHDDLMQHRPGRYNSAGRWAGRQAIMKENACLSTQAGRVKRQHAPIINSTVVLWGNLQFKVPNPKCKLLRKTCCACVVALQSKQATLSLVIWVPSCCGVVS